MNHKQFRTLKVQDVKNGMKYGYIDVYGKFYDCGEKNHIQIDRKVY